ncbi:hypothetical protein [Streptomyces sp. AF1A]|uniref:hypothetical protein n=1 Tax=Streptomyces sp. AF1A TaxID=3394350 RepID=UPI0039BC64F3
MNAVSAALFDRDGTLVADVPYDRDPDRAGLLPGAAQAVSAARSAALPAWSATSPASGAGCLTDTDVRRADRRADELPGGLDAGVFSPHAPDAGCPRRKPQLRRRSAHRSRRPSPRRPQRARDDAGRDSPARR